MDFGIIKLKFTKKKANLRLKKKSRGQKISRYGRKV
jgi:hypothetical protein